MTNALRPDPLGAATSWAGGIDGGGDDDVHGRGIMGGRERRSRLAEPEEPGRPHAPGYGIRPDAEGLLPWSFVEERMAAARWKFGDG